MARPYKNKHDFLVLFFKWPDPINKRRPLPDNYPVARMLVCLSVCVQPVSYIEYIAHRVYPSSQLHQPERSLPIGASRGGLKNFRL